jgi:hypothetical protein
MRKLKTSDIPAFCRCLKNIGIKDEIKAIAADSSSAADAWDNGFQLIWNIFDLATEKAGEQHLYEFLAGPFETKPEDLADMDLDVFFAGCKQLADENNLSGFFKSAAKLMK